MIKLVLTFKSGAQVKVDVIDYTATPNGLGGFGSLDWNTPEDWTAKLTCVDLAQIACMHEERTPARRRIQRHNPLECSDGGCQNKVCIAYWNAEAESSGLEPPEYWED